MTAEPIPDIPEPWAEAMRNVNIGNPRNGVPSYRALAERAGVSVETVRHMVNGSRRPDEETVRAVAGALNLDSPTLWKWMSS